jgi:hypothetical protein
MRWWRRRAVIIGVVSIVFSAADVRGVGAVKPNPNVEELLLRRGILEVPFRVQIGLIILSLRQRLADAER